MASTRERVLPRLTETPLAPFTELVATAIANAEARAELTASRARRGDGRRAAAPDRARPDPAAPRLDQRCSCVRPRRPRPADMEELAHELRGVATGLDGALEELREFARSIHAAILADRVEALSGRLTLRSEPGAGTSVTVELPLAGAAPEPAGDSR